MSIYKLCGSKVQVAMSLNLASTKISSGPKNTQSKLWESQGSQELFAHTRLSGSGSVAAVRRSSQSLSRNVSSNSQLQASLWKSIRHPRLLPQNLLKLIAGDAWIAARTKINLFPLHFYDPDAERDFKRRYLALNATPGRVADGVLFFMFLLVVSTGSVIERRGWLGIHDKLVTVTWEAVGYLMCVMSVGLNAFSWLQRLRPYHECAYYIFGGLSATIICGWSVFALERASKTKPHPSADAYAQLQWTHHWLIFKMIVDAFVTSVCLLNVIQADMLLDTFSRYSLYVHILSWAVFVGARLGQEHLLDNALSTTNIIDCVFMFILYCCGWSFRWFRELQDRGVVVTLEESQARVARVRDTQKKKRRRRTQSAAEEVSDLLLRSREVVESSLSEYKDTGDRTRIDGDEGASSCLRDTVLILTEVLKKLVVAGNEAHESTVQSTTSPQEAVNEDVFISMYANKRTGVLENATGRTETGRKERQFSAGVRFGTNDTTEFDDKEAPISVVRKHLIRLHGVDVPMLLLTNKLDHLVGRDFGLRLLDYYKQGVFILQEIGFILLRPHVPYLETSDEILQALLFSLEKFYSQDNPYHNPCHAASVAHYAMCILSVLGLTEYVIQLELIAFILSCLIHDVGHPGRNSLFFLNANTSLALLYNDGSILEQAHCTIGQLLVNSCPEVDILATLSIVERLNIRKLTIQWVLATDMAAHFEILSKSRVRQISPDFNPMTDVNDRLMTLTLALKAADLSHCCLDWGQHLEWSLRKAEECYQQGSDEQRLGLPISPLCERQEHLSFPRTQSGFIQYVVLPLIEELVVVDTSRELSMEMMTKLLFNKQKWDLLKEANRTEEISSTITSMRITSPFFLDLCLAKSLQGGTFAKMVENVSKAFIRAL